MIWHQKLLFLTGIAILANCATAPITTPYQSKNTIALCDNELASVHINFPTARANDCRITSDNSLILTIKPENKPINPSPWYAFKIHPKHRGELIVELNYSDAKHRYRPKISTDGQHWELMRPSNIKKISNQKIQLTVKLDTKPVYIAGQEILSVNAHNNWMDEMSQRHFVEKTKIGTSLEGRSLYKLEARADVKVKKPYVVFIGRQHPPEVTGALALIPFVETVLGDSQLAQQFRGKYNVLIIPNMNPDGVTHGNWRHNMGGVDLNRDWVKFKQPETKAVKNEFDRFKTGQDEIVLFVDFHSTWRNLLYTQTEDQPTTPPLFTRKWVHAVNERLDKKIYKFTREKNKATHSSTSKAYMYKTYGIPAITYEVGDNTDRQAIKIAADIFAQEMMKILLIEKKE